MDMTKVVEAATTGLTALFSTPGIVAWFKTRETDNDTEFERALLRELVRIRIIELCELYIERGYVLSGEYSDLYEDLYEPYTKMGGNGLAHHIFERVEKLPMLPDGTVREESK